MFSNIGIFSGRNIIGNFVARLSKRPVPLLNLLTPMKVLVRLEPSFLAPQGRVWGQNFHVVRRDSACLSRVKTRDREPRWSGAEAQGFSGLSVQVAPGPGTRFSGCTRSRMTAIIWSAERS